MFCDDSMTGLRFYPKTRGGTTRWMPSTRGRYGMFNSVVIKYMVDDNVDVDMINGDLVSPYYFSQQICGGRMFVVLL